MIGFVGAGISIEAVTYGLARYVYGLFLPQIQSDLALTTQLMGMIASTSYIGYLLATIIGTYITAITGPRFPIMLGGFAATIGMGLIAFSHSGWVLAIGVFIAGASPGFSYPPISDAIVQTIASPDRSRIYSFINIGTSYGIILAGPIALLSGDNWRLSWFIFSALALIATVWNFFQMPHRRKATAQDANAQDAFKTKISFDCYMQPRARALFLAAIMLGILTSVYWTFSVDLISTVGNISKYDASTFWILTGISGIAGGYAGHLVKYFGLRRVFRLCVLTLSAAVAALAIFYAQLPMVFISGALFGAGFITITALLGIWSVYVFNDHPSAGFGITFFLISLGQFIGPIFAGFVGAEYGLPLLFLLTALSCTALIAFAPSYDVRSMTPDGG